MFDAWSTIATIGGAGALSYLAAGQKPKEGPDAGKPTLRLSLDKGGSLLGDVRLLGGAITTAAAYWASPSTGTKKVLGGVAMASFASLICTELVRYRFRKDNPEVLAAAPYVPQFFDKATEYRGLSQGAYGGQYHARSSAWAQR